MVVSPKGGILAKTKWISCRPDQTMNGIGRCGTKCFFAPSGITGEKYGSFIMTMTFLCIHWRMTMAKDIKLNADEMLVVSLRLPVEAIARLMRVASIGDDFGTWQDLAVDYIIESLPDEDDMP
jgi:hypothetical protein